MLANLYLHHFEHMFRQTFVTGQEFTYIYRYIDDLLWISMDGYYIDLGTIYPEELQINKVNMDVNKADYLDLHLFKSENKIVSKIFDKRRMYSFDILGLPSPDSVVSKKLVGNVMNSQFLRYSNVCTFASDFVDNCQLFNQKLSTNGYDKIQIMKLVKVFFHKHSKIFDKFKIEDVNKLFESTP